MWWVHQAMTSALASTVQEVEHGCEAENTVIEPESKGHTIQGIGEHPMKMLLGNDS
jgi:hypothetical protein